MADPLRSEWEEFQELALGKKDEEIDRKGLESYSSAARKAGLIREPGATFEPKKESLGLYRVRKTYR